MLRNNLILIILSIIVLTGCATTQPPGINTVIQKVEVPVQTACKAAIPPTPAFNFDKLKLGDDIFVQTQALLADRLLHLGFENQLLVALKSCK
jgi:hypothetical protein